MRLPLYPTISLEEYPENGVEMSPQRKNGGGAGHCTRLRQVGVQVYPCKVEDTVDTVGRNVFGFLVRMDRVGNALLPEEPNLRDYSGRLSSAVHRESVRVEWAHRWG